jgi:hypothetical protein
MRAAAGVHRKQFIARPAATARGREVFFIPETSMPQ